MIRLRNFIVAWAFISIPLGVAATQVPWGDPEGFHGIGMPFAGVYWDYLGDAEYPTDYPNPYAGILNSAVFLIVGSIAILVIYSLVARLRDIRSNQRERAA